jgi:hypothetical protein
MLDTNSLDEIAREICQCKFGRVCTTLGRKPFAVESNKNVALYIHPTSGYIGSDYDSETDIFFLAQNPGRPLNNEWDQKQYALVMTMEEHNAAYIEALEHYYMYVMISRFLKIPRNKMAWFNVVKCPTERNRELVTSEFIMCNPFLHRQMAIIKPKIVVAMGNWATRFMNASTLQGVTRTLHGFTISMPHYSRANHAQWMMQLKQYVDTVREHMGVQC